MLTETFHSIVTATRNVFRNWQSMLLMAAVYASLLALLYLFVSIREATLPQVILTFVFAVTAPLLFFILQTMVASGSARQAARESSGETEQLSAGLLLKSSLTSFWKLILITLPLIVLAVARYFVLFKTTQSKAAWLELSFLVARLVVVFALTLFGWTITVRALGRFSSGPQPEPANEAA